jgi:hypothetical protein
VPVATGEFDPVFARAARVVEAEYEWPFQSHVNTGPAAPSLTRAGRNRPVMAGLHSEAVSGW